jgi:riboflavin biosynthesis pyrimidine reductase
MTTPLPPLEILASQERGPALPLPADLAAVYGRLDLPPHPGRPYVIGNFVSTLDGVVALNTPGSTQGGGEISGYNQHDRVLMGLLRAISDAVIVGAGTLRSVPKHRWTPQAIFPPLAEAYQQLRATLGKPEPPLQVIVTASGDLDLTLPVFQSGEAPALIVTTASGAARLSAHALPAWVQVQAVEGADRLSASAVLNAVNLARPCDIILTEGGPVLLGDFLAEGKLDELFLTLAPQVAGRDSSVERPGFVAGTLFAPAHPLWSTLVDVRRASSHLFLRYAFTA